LLRFSITSVREKLEVFRKVAWMPILGVSCLSLLVSFCNYRFQVKYTPPHLEFANGDVFRNNRSKRLYFNNARESIAWRAKSLLFPMEGKNPTYQSFGEADVAGAGGRIFPGFSSQAEFDLPIEVPNRFLACVVYSDESDTFTQAFVLALQKGQNGQLTVIEESEAQSSICPASQ
jgi:hypothetical protein